MPIKLLLDTSQASDTETTDFLKAHSTLLQGAIQSAAGAEFAFKSAGASPAPSQADVYKEMMLSIRQYGTIRYILFPLYLTISGILVGAFFKGEYKIPHAVLLGAGIASSAIWLVFEYALSESLRRTWNEVTKIVGNGNIFPTTGAAINPLAHRSGLVVIPPRIAFYFIYGAGTAFWLCMLFENCRLAMGN